MVQYNPSNLKYPKDAKMHESTQIDRKKHGINKISIVQCNNHIKQVSYSQYIDEKKP